MGDGLSSPQKCRSDPHFWGFSTPGRLSGGRRSARGQPDEGACRIGEPGGSNRMITSCLEHTGARMFLSDGLRQRKGREVQAIDKRKAARRPLSGSQPTAAPALFGYVLARHHDFHERLLREVDGARQRADRFSPGSGRDAEAGVGRPLAHARGSESKWRIPSRKTSSGVSRLTTRNASRSKSKKKPG